jgi:hypothetical protein
LRTTLTYQFTPRLSLGVEYNPRAQDVGLLVNFIAVTETNRRPAVILGSSSDRIGTPRSRALYGTISKDLGSLLHLPVAPYLGLSYGGFDRRLRPIAGLNIRLQPKISSLIIFDGVKVHPSISYTLSNRQTLTFLMAQSRNPGFSYSISF